MTQDKFLIGELAAKADVTVRTIRYYLAEGLLPTPVNEGKYAHFNQEHLDRLELIRRLKALHLPLEDIRQILAATNPTDLHQLLEFQEKANPILFSSKPVRETGKPGKAALNYLSSLTTANQSLHEPDRMFIPDSPERVRKPSAKARSEPRVGRESWERIQLAPGVELHLRATHDPVLQDQIEQLVRFAQRLFQNQKGESHDR